MLYLPSGQKLQFEFHTEQEYQQYCLAMTKLHGPSVFEMCWPSKKIFTVFRDKQDNQIEVVFKATTVGEMQ